jgi:hypothetical protein
VTTEVFLCDKNAMPLQHVILVIVFLISGSLVSAKEEQPYPSQGPKVFVTVIAAPLSPSLSTISFDLPLGSLVSTRALNRIEASCWIISDSPYLIPHSYFELGLLLDWELVSTSRHRLAAGVGTAIGIETLRRSLSTPLILRLKYHFVFRRRLSFETTGEGFLYGQGGGFQFHLRALSRPFELGFIIGLGIGYGFLSEWDFNPHGDALQLDVTVGYSWPRFRGTKQ